MSDYFLKEIIQSGAVATAIAEDFTTGKGAQGGHVTDEVLDAIRMERKRQIEKWGSQHNDLPVWLVVLMEEVGEAADELDIDEIEDIDLRNLLQSIGSLGAACKGYLEWKFGW